MKHKNGQVKDLGMNKWYVSFGNGFYLRKNGEVLEWDTNKHTSTTTDHLLMHETCEQAQATLDKYNKAEPALSEIKEKLSAAKKLIGKKIKILKGRLEGRVGEVLSVDLALDMSEVKGPLTIEFMEENGYAVLLKAQNFTCLYDNEVFKVLPNIGVKNHDGEEYFAEQHDKYWQFGCAKISKQMIKDSLTLIDTNYADGNREINKVTIGAADFDFETLKKLVDADNNKG